MNSLLSTTDLFIFFGSLVAVMGFGLWAGRKKIARKTISLPEDTRWWGVAGSIFGSSVSANHIAGMMGVGFAVGFAQSHFEITAIAGLLMLCYFFLPVYRKLNVFTLSDYLSKRYDDKSRISYALIMVVIMVVIQMVPGFYIGSRSINILLQGDTGRKAVAEAVVSNDSSLTEIKILHGWRKYGKSPGTASRRRRRLLTFNPTSKRARRVSGVTCSKGGQTDTFDPQAPPTRFFVGGNSTNPLISPGDADPFYYQIGILIMAIVTGAYVILGGLKAVIVTDVIQSVLLLLAGLLVAFIVFNPKSVDGQTWQPGTLGRKVDRLHLYNSSNQPDPSLDRCAHRLDGSSLLLLGNQPVHRTKSLVGRSDKEARMGILAAGFFKLLIPFFSIGTGIAAYYLFKDRNMIVASDAVFIKLLTELIAPHRFRSGWLDRGGHDRGDSFQPGFNDEFCGHHHDLRHLQALREARGRPTSNSSPWGAYGSLSSLF